MRAAIASPGPERVLPLPRVLADIERKHERRHYADGRPDPAVVRVYYMLQLYAGANGTGEVEAAEITRRLHLSRQAVSLALRRLVGLRLIQIARRLDGKLMLVRFLFREIYRLFKRGCTRVVNGVLSFWSSFPQDASPVVPMVLTRGVTAETSKDGRGRAATRGASMRSPGALLGRLRHTAAAAGVTSDPRAKTLLATVGHLAFHGGRFADFQAHPTAADAIASAIRTRFGDAPPRDSGRRRLWSWARSVVEEALVRAKHGAATVPDTDDGAEYVSVSGLLDELRRDVRSMSERFPSEIEAMHREDVEAGRLSYAERAAAIRAIEARQTDAARQAIAQATRDRWEAYLRQSGGADVLA